MVYGNVWGFLVPFLSEKVPIEIVHFQSFCNNNIRHRRLNYGPISQVNVKYAQQFLVLLDLNFPALFGFCYRSQMIIFLKHNDFGQI